MPPAALADAVQTVHAGEALLDPQVMRRVIAAHVGAPRAALDAPAQLRAGDVPAVGRVG